ncbi:MAG: Ubiquinone/menaquinone biosynthesis methyltransferase UBIE [Parcubacteria group bacterium GW2011_GWA2_43_9b]|nr:MAG: Ubiquinone/menaquinone biosynthesis methyltransferase UBIE [Parcubacteria group bacterium GW2011_GWA2_43_9b]
MPQNYKKVIFDFEALDTCPLCQGKVFISNGRIKWLKTDFWYVACPQCGLKFINPRPTLESYRDFYKNLFWEQKIRNLGFHQPGQAWQAGKYKWDNEKEWQPEPGRKIIIEKTKTVRAGTIDGPLKDNINLNSKTDILEVGCGYPVILESLKENFGCRVYAIEPSEEVWETAKKDNSPVKFIGRYAEELKELAEKNLKFDAIIFSHALENTTDPVKIIGYAKKCLRPSGLIYVQTPNLLVNDQMNPYHPFIFSGHTKASNHDQ